MKIPILVDVERNLSQTRGEPKQMQGYTYTAQTPLRRKISCFPAAQPFGGGAKSTGHCAAERSGAQLPVLCAAPPEGCAAGKHGSLRHRGVWAVYVYPRICLGSPLV
ncbi:hypothetical protein TNCV_4242221 [Trichonephila clavipes]|nr:hypothetical protein TNCV_4242221 [Trichonephila clavipes]